MNVVSVSCSIESKKFYRMLKNLLLRLAVTHIIVYNNTRKEGGSENDREI